MTMTTITTDELTAVEGGWCLPLTPIAPLVHLLTGVCIGLSNEAN